MIDEMPAQNIVKQNESQLICYNAGYEPESYAIAVAKDNTELLNVVNKVLNRLLDEGKIDEFIVAHS